VLLYQQTSGKHLAGWWLQIFSLIGDGAFLGNERLQDKKPAIRAKPVRNKKHLINQI